jgi:Uma2 family endonuclease
MSKSAPPTRWTYEEFARLPEGDGNRYEVIAGELYVSPAPGTRHQRVLTGLVVALETHVAQHGLGDVLVGPIDVLFAEGDYLEPDLVFIRSERTSIESERGIEAAPDLIVEVLSASTARRDRTLKRERYMLYGVREYWVVDHEVGEVLVYRSSAESARPAIYRDRLVWRAVEDAPALEIDLNALFQNR